LCQNAQVLNIGDDGHASVSLYGEDGSGPRQRLV
jgi:hypothetical protein